jgi:hypothetical protein
LVPLITVAPIKPHWPVWPWPWVELKVLIPHLTLVIFMACGVATRSAVAPARRCGTVWCSGVTRRGAVRWVGMRHHAALRQN